MTTQEREKVAALVEAAYKEGWNDAPDDKYYSGGQSANSEWPYSNAKEALDALLAETHEACRWKATSGDYLHIPCSECMLITSTVPKFCQWCGRPVEVVEAS